MRRGGGAGSGTSKVVVELSKTGFDSIRPEDRLEITFSFKQSQLLENMKIPIIDNSITFNATVLKNEYNICTLNIDKFYNTEKIEITGRMNNYFNELILKDSQFQFEGDITRSVKDLVITSVKKIVTGGGKRKNTQTTPRRSRSIKNRKSKSKSKSKGRSLRRRSKNRRSKKGRQGKP